MGFGMEEWQDLDLLSAVFLLAASVSGYVGFVMRIKGVNESPISVSSILFLSEIVFAYSIRWAIQSQLKTNLTSYLGACVLTFAIFLSFYQRITTVEFSDRLQWTETNDDCSYKAPCEITTSQEISTSYSVA